MVSNGPRQIRIRALEGIYLLASAQSKSQTYLPVSCDNVCFFSSACYFDFQIPFEIIFDLNV